MYEQPKIILQQHQYLGRMRRNRRENRPVVYLDETWANSHCSHERLWVESDDKVQGGTKGEIRKTSGKGTCLIILHAGSENGWIDGADLVFQSKKATGDYHDEMNSDNFEEWFHDKLLCNVPCNSLIVMDNASYHVDVLKKCQQVTAGKVICKTG